ncbi:hypothetical protein [Crateriforma conspicua]|uniref:hypothetical protein n=1 Tax=Crateriforma conspicua TaxID=2527996 RepID=UPI0011878309|nr:hypothetical protein [Crateriforma conspicua]QDV64060.1 hypothetical protein Mal65_32080 [Crateriforma conspicua]
MKMRPAAALRVPEHARLSRSGLHFIFCERQGASRRYAAGSEFADSVELIDDQQVVARRVSKVDDFSVDRFLAIIGVVFDFDVAGVKPVQLSVVLFQAGMNGIGVNVLDIIDGRLRKIRIQSSHCFGQSIFIDDESIVIPFWIVSVGRYVHAVSICTARLAEPVERKLFELAFCDH